MRSAVGGLVVLSTRQWQQGPVKWWLYVGSAHRSRQYGFGNARSDRLFTDTLSHLSVSSDRAQNGDDDSGEQMGLDACNCVAEMGQ